MRINRLLCRPENRGVDSGREGDAKRVVRRHRDDARVGADELVEILRVAAHEVRRRKPPEQRLLEHAHAGRHISRAAIVVVLDIAPLRVLLVEDAFEPHRQRGHAHLNEIARVVDDFRQRRGEDDTRARAFARNAFARTSAGCLSLIQSSDLPQGTDY